MRNIVYLLTDPNGRIGRQKFWLGVFCILLVFFAISALLMALGLRSTQVQAGTVSINGGQPQGFSGVRWTLTPWVAFTLTAMMAIPATMLSIKRRKDRGSSGLDVVAYWVLAILANLLGLFGAEGFYVSAMQVVLLVWSVCLFVLLAVLRGTPGPNQYGPDPLAPASTAEAAGPA